MAECKKGGLTDEDLVQYKKVRQYMLHAPVLEFDCHTGTTSLVPLNDLPDDVDNWGEYIGIDSGDLTANQDLLNNLYNCKVLPLERKPLESYNRPVPDPIFGDLNFTAHPIKAQPKLCLVNFLRARRLEARMTNPRDEVESVVRSCLRIHKPIQSPPLQPIASQHDGFIAIKIRADDNEYDNWSRNYSELAMKLKGICDDYIDNLLGEKRKDRPSIRKRVQLLVNGGFYDPKTIKCRNVESKADGTKCVLLCCDCLSSKTSVVHTVYAVFEDRKDGVYLLDLSSCSCKKGGYFCSHSIGFLHFLSIVQQRNLSREEFESNYKVNPKFITGVLMLIENAVAPDKFKRESAQRKRQKTK